jgi:hypothetical protein
MRTPIAVSFRFQRLLAARADTITAVCAIQSDGRRTTEPPESEPVGITETRRPYLFKLQAIGLPLCQDLLEKHAVLALQAARAAPSIPPPSPSYLGITRHCEHSAMPCSSELYPPPLICRTVLC